jgi:anaphase-promoting complex subunit 3
VAYSPSPPSAALSPRSEVSPSPSNWTSAQEQLAQEEYEADMAEHYVYELLRRFARASRALSHYDCQKCLEELEKLPHAQQKSSAVVAMVGKAHYEQQDFSSVRYDVVAKLVSIS